MWSRLDKFDQDQTTTDVFEYWPVLFELCLIMRIKMNIICLPTSYYLSMKTEVIFSFARKHNYKKFITYYHYLNMKARFFLTVCGRLLFFFFLSLRFLNQYVCDRELASANSAKRRYSDLALLQVGFQCNIIEKEEVFELFHLNNVKRTCL